MSSDKPIKPTVKPVTFQWISNRTTTPYVTIDSQQRLYISKPARDLLGLPDKQRFKLIAGYDFANHRVVLAKPEVVRVTNVVPFKFDKRAYSKARAFVQRAQIERILPARFTFAGRDFSEYEEGSYAFALEGYVPADRVGEDEF